MQAKHKKEQNSVQFPIVSKNAFSTYYEECRNTDANYIKTIFNVFNYSSTMAALSPFSGAASWPIGFTPFSFILRELFPIVKLQFGYKNCRIGYNFVTFSNKYLYFLFSPLPRGNFVVEYKITILLQVISMTISKFNDRKWVYLLLAFAAPFVSMMILMLIAGYTPFGDRSMLYSDMWHQYYPFFKAFRQALRNGDSLLYSWNVGLGLDYLGLISYYLASPLNILSVLIPDGWVQGYFGMLMPIKLGFAGLFFAIFLKKTFGKEDLSLPLFGWFYAMCAWALGYQWNVMWLDTFALLPLVALGTISLLKDRKFFLYTVTLFLSIFCNYYIGFFTCIFVLLTFICYQICNCKSVLRFFSDLLRIGVFSVLAIGMTAILELPALAALQTTQSSVNTFPEGFALNIVDYELCSAAKEAWNAFKEAKEAGEEGLWGLWFAAMKESFPPILEGMRQVAGNMSGGIEPSYKEGLPNLYCGVGTITLAFLFLTAERVKLREKLCCVFLLVFFILSVLIRQLDYIWHGFHFTNMIPYRFTFLFSFVMLYMAYRAFLMRRQFQLWQIIPAGMLTLCIFLCSDNYTDPVFIAYNAVFFLLYMAVFIVGRLEFKVPDRSDREAMAAYISRRKTRRSYLNIALAAIMCVELIMNLVSFGVQFPYTGISNYPKGTTYTESMIRYMKEREDELFYRTEVTHTQTLNDAALNDYNGISTFTSSANVNVTKFMKHLGYAAKETYNRYSFEESSPVSNLFLNLKYMVERDGKLESNNYFDEVWHYGNVYLLENNAYLPLGFLAESDLGELTFETMGSSFLFQNALFSAATGIDSSVWDLYQGKTLTIEPNGTNLTTQTKSGYSYYKNGSAQTTLVYRYDFTQAGFFCVDLNMSVRNSFTVWRNGVELYSESLSLPQMMAVSQVEPGDNIEIKITCKANENGSITIGGALLDEGIFRQGYGILATSVMEITDFSNTRIEGSIHCDRDGLLYTSIPQNGENWSVTVDGREAEVVLVGNCMVAVDLTAGEHDIVFRYHNKAFSLGWKVTLICFVIFIALTMAVYQPWKKYFRKGKYEK